MSPTRHGFPYFEIQFGKDGRPVTATEVDAVGAFLATGAATDLIVLSHGWNNDLPEARALFDRFCARVRAVADGGSVPLPGRSFAVVGVFWPSKRFTEPSRIPGGAASFGAPNATAAVADQLTALAGVFDDPNADVKLEDAAKLLSQLEYNPAARTQFADLVRSLLTRDGPDADGDGDGDAGGEFFSTAGDTLMTRLSRPILPAPGATGGGAAGFNPLAGAGQLVSGFAAAAQRLLNYATYWQMKGRAGAIGRGGVHAWLREIRDAHSTLKLHLVGHSFGARLVTAATLGPAGAPPLRPATLTLLQGAFSHYGFAERYDAVHDGLFRPVLAARMVDGPILVTCTANDEAVGTLYPLASMVAGQIASALGDRNDPYGGMGRNGAQKTPEASDGILLALGGSYGFAAGTIYNLQADAVIRDHGDIAHDEVAYALLGAIAVS